MEDTTVDRTKMEYPKVRTRVGMRTLDLCVKCHMVILPSAPMHTMSDCRNALINRCDDIRHEMESINAT